MYVAERGKLLTETGDTESAQYRVHPERTPVPDRLPAVLAPPPPSPNTCTHVFGYCEGCCRQRRRKSLSLIIRIEQATLGPWGNFHSTSTWYYFIHEQTTSSSDRLAASSIHNNVLVIFLFNNKVFFTPYNESVSLMGFTTKPPHHCKTSTHRQPWGKRSATCVPDPRQAWTREPWDKGYKTTSPFGKRPLGRPTRKWHYNIKMNLTEKTLVMRNNETHFYWILFWGGPTIKCPVMILLVP
jgi:hypothetical protein